MEEADSRLEAGFQALCEGREQEAMDLLLPLAQSGEASAQAHVGLIYMFHQEFSQAIYWLKKAHGQGRGDAAHNLGTLYLGCDPKEPEESARWYLAAYDLGFVVTQESFYQFMRDFLTTPPDQRHRLTPPGIPWPSSSNGELN